MQDRSLPRGPAACRCQVLDGKDILHHVFVELTFGGWRIGRIDESHQERKMHSAAVSKTSLGGTTIYLISYLFRLLSFLVALGTFL